MKYLQTCSNPTQPARAGFFFALLLFCLSAAAPAQKIPQGIVLLQDSVEVSSIRFTGNEQFSAGTLLGLIQTRETPAGFWTFIYRNVSEVLGSEPRYFDHEVFQQDLEVLRQHYQNNGYFHAQLQGEYTLDTTNRMADIRFTINEDRASYIDTVIYRNMDRLSDSLRQIILTGQLVRYGNRYRAADLQAEIERITTLLENNGYPDARTDSVTVQRRISTNNVTIMLPLLYGRRLQFGEISLESDSSSAGHVVVARRLIEERLEFKKGDTYSRERREQAEMNLNKLRIFSLARVNAFFPAVRDTTRTDVPILVALQPRNRFEVGIGPLVNNQYGRFNLGVSANGSWLNIFGAAQILSTTIQYQGSPTLHSDFSWVRLESYQGTFGFKFEQPYFLDNATSAFSSFTILTAREKEQFTVDLYQLVFGFKRQFIPRIAGGLDIAFERSDFRLLGTLSRDFATLVPERNPYVNFFNDIVTASIDLDYTDDFFNPVSGHHQKIILEESGRLAAGIMKSIAVSLERTTYHKIEWTSLWFQDVSRVATAILAGKFRAGGIFRYGGSRERDLPIPPTRTYYAGGSNSVRGWSSKQLAVDSSRTAFGSNALFEGSIELRWSPFKRKPVPFLFNLQPLGIVLFVDAGNLWNEFASFRLTEVAIAFGLGIRYNTPFGPIRIDYGVRWYDPAARRNAWITERSFFPETVATGALHFGIAHAF